MTMFTAVCGVTLLRTLSKASIAAFAAAAVLYLLRDSHMSRRAKVWIGIGSATVIASSWGLLETYANTYDQVNHVETLTGRTFIWAVAWEEALKSPWLGHGFYSFRFVIPADGSLRAVAGAQRVLTAVFLLWDCRCGDVDWPVLELSTRDSGMRAAENLQPWPLPIMLFAVVRGLVDTERFDINYPLWLITLFMLALRQSSAGGAVSKPLISIVTPSFNQAKFLGECLASVEAQASWPD